MPVIVLADVSGSMVGAKIKALNEALRQMVESFAEIDGARGVIHVGVVAFHDDAQVVLHPTPAARAKLEPLKASGMTSMGKAFDLIREVLDDPDAIPRGSYLPTLVLISDGQPNDSGFEESLNALLAAPRASKALRLAMAIGEDADVDVLRRFVAHPEIPVVRARDAASIHKFFRFVTYTVTQRSLSMNPNAMSAALLPAPRSVDLDDDDLVY